jgi:hypothetical protein
MVGGQRKREDVEVCPVGVARDQTEELAVGGGQGRIGHQVEQTNPQIVEVGLGFAHIYPFFPQPPEGGQRRVGD